MATKKEELQILLTMKDNATKELKKVEKQVSKMGTGFKKMGAIAKKVAIGIGAIGAVAVIAGAKAIKAFQAQERAMVTLENAIINVAGATMKEVDALKAQAQALQKIGVIGDEVTMVGQAQLATFGLSTKAIGGLTSSMLDYSVAMFGVNVTQEQINQSANVFGKLAKGIDIGRLKNQGIMVSEAQKKMLEYGTEAERVATVQEVMSANLKITNEMMRKTSEGGVQALKNSFGDLLEMVGERLIPILQFLVDKATILVDAFKSVMETTGGLQAIFTGFFEFINEKTGLITILSEAWNNLVIVFQERLLPVLMELWEALKPLQPFLILLAKVIGVILYGAIIAFVKLVEVSLIVVMEGLRIGVEKAISVVDAFKAGWDAVTTVLAKVIGFIDNLISKIKSLNVLQGAKNMISSAMGFIGGKALGGSVFAGQPVKVGEQGEEMFVPNTGGKIVPNRQLGGGGGTVLNITVHGDVTGEDAMDKLAQKMMDNLGMNARITAGA